MFCVSNYSTGSKGYDNSNKVVIGKIKDESGGVAMEERVRLKPGTYSVLVDDNSEHKKAKGVNRNNAAIISHNEYKYVLFNNKCIIHSIIEYEGMTLGYRV